MFVENRWWKIAERDRELRVLEVEVEAPELVGGAERLVRHGAERERGDVDAGDALGPPAGAVGAPLGVRLGGRSEQSCSIRGMASAVGRGGGSTGTSRQPSGSSPSVRQASSTPPRSHVAEEAHREPGAARRRSASARAAGAYPRRRPVTPSAALAPRCATAASPASRRSRSSRDARPPASATRPIPQASRSRGRSSRRVWCSQVFRLSDSKRKSWNVPPAGCSVASPAVAGEEPASARAARPSRTGELPGCEEDSRTSKARADHRESIVETPRAHAASSDTRPTRPTAPPESNGLGGPAHVTRTTPRGTPSALLSLYREICAGGVPCSCRKCDGSTQLSGRASGQRGRQISSPPHSALASTHNETARHDAPRRTEKPRGARRTRNQRQPRLAPGEHTPLLGVFAAGLPCFLGRRCSATPYPTAHSTRASRYRTASH